MQENITLFFKKKSKILKNKEPCNKPIISNRFFEHICLDLLLPVCFLTALVLLPASAQPLHLAVTRYVFDETSAHLNKIAQEP